MPIAMSIEGFEGLQWGDMWPRHVKYGECEAWCGSGLIVVVTRAFTPDEDLLFDWVVRQDKCFLYGIHHLPDGLDLIVFERQFVSQSREQAFEEHLAHLRKMLLERGITPLIFAT